MKRQTKCQAREGLEDPEREKHSAVRTRVKSQEVPSQGPEIEGGLGSPGRRSLCGKAEV